MIKAAIAGSLVALAVVYNSVNAACTASSEHAHLYIGWPNDGETLRAYKPFRVWFGLRHMGTAPKGVDKPHTGHHHLLIDRDLPALDEPIPAATVDHDVTRLAPFDLHLQNHP